MSELQKWQANQDRKKAEKQRKREAREKLPEEERFALELNSQRKNEDEYGIDEDEERWHSEEEQAERKEKRRREMAYIAAHNAVQRNLENRRIREIERDNPGPRINFPKKRVNEDAEEERLYLEAEERENEKQRDIQRRIKDDAQDAKDCARQRRIRETLDKEKANPAKLNFGITKSLNDISYLRRLKC